MKSCRVASVLLVLLVGGAVANAASFVESLTPEQKHRLGLDQLTPQQLAELNQTIDAYKKDATAVAVKEYKEKEEPSVVSRALDIFRRKTADAQQERFTSTISDKFSGWDGHTVFKLENGQVWRQANKEVYFRKAAENVGVVVFKAHSGYWRLQVLETGAWVTVERVQ
jgi:hypothetical protein